MKKGYLSNPGLAKEAGMIFVAGCPDASLPHRGLNFSPRVSASTVETKRACFFRSFTSSLSGTSFPSAALVAPFPLLALGAMAVEKRRGIRKQSEHRGGKAEARSSGLCSRKKREIAFPRLGRA